jgi:malonyl-CoA O-methyltransferase
VSSWWPFKNKIPTLEPLEGYNLWARSYQNESNPIKQFSDQFIIDHLPLIKGKTVLDAGCGSGKFCALAEQREAKKIVGIDLSPEMIAISKKNCNDAVFSAGDITKIDLPENEFDLVICALVLGHQEKLNPSLSKLIKSVTANGLLLITDFHPYLTMNQSKRTFKGEDDKTYEIKHYLHHFEDYFECAKQNNAVIRSVKEPKYNGSPVIFGMEVIRE